MAHITTDTPHWHVSVALGFKYLFAIVVAGGGEGAPQNLFQAPRQNIILSILGTHSEKPVLLFRALEQKIIVSISAKKKRRQSVFLGLFLFRVPGRCIGRNDTNGARADVRTL